MPIIVCQTCPVQQILYLKEPRRYLKVIHMHLHKKVPKIYYIFSRFRLYPGDVPRFILLCSKGPLDKIMNLLALATM